MAIIKKFSPFQNLSSFQVFLNDTERTSQYFKITEFEDTLTGGKNGFLIEGSEYLKESTEVKVELLDVENNPIYFEPGDGIPEYYEGISKLVSVHVYDDTPIGTGKITILGELKNYIDENGAVVPVPDEWKGIYNVKWERTFQVNKNLNNETIVRFYKRPIVNITELVKPIFSKSIPTVTDTGYAHGISETPIDGTDIRNWRTGTIYRLRRTSGTWDRDVDENTITFTSPSFTANIVEVLNDTDVLVDVPYTINNLVSNFTSGSYSVSYADFQNEVIGESTLTGSFAKIDITQLKTFVGDVARVKVFRKSRNSVGDFQFVQESKLESTELLRDVTTPSNTEIPYGRFDESNLSTYWITSSADHEVSIDSSVLSQAVKFDYDSVQGGVQRLITSQSFSISKDVEYTLNFRTLLSGSLDDSGKSVRAFFSSSNFTQDFLTASGSAIYRTRQNVSQNILSENTGDAHLVFEVKGDDWYVSNVSLKNAQDTSFSPDEFTLIQDIPRKLASETFDFRFEFYDINNNYIPVDVTAVGVFDGGNDFPTSGKLLTFESDRNAFRFTSGSIGSPPFQQLQFKVTQNNLTGSVSFASSAFDEDGNYIDPSSYGGTYPGTLTSVTPAGAILRIADFSGSDESVIVGSIVYTASLEGLEEFETVYRLEDGDNAPTLLVTSNANQFTYEPTSLIPKPVGQSITVRAQRKNLASLVTPITVNSGSNRPALTYVDTVGGIDTYTISATEFSSSFSANSFDEVTYQFTGSDVFGIEQTDEITLSKVVNFDGVSITLSNESTAFRSNGQGLILDSFDSGDGEVEVRIADKEIDHSNGLSSPNTFDIVSATATNVTEAYSSYLTNQYGINAMSADSGSLVLNISYLAGDNSTTQSFQKKVNYNKNRIAQPSIIIDTTNKTQNVDAKSTGVQLTSFEDSTITVREFYTGSVTTFSSSDVAISFDSNPSTIATDNGDLTLSYSNLANATNSTQVQFTATVTDSEGTSRSVSDSISLSKTLDAAPNVEFQVTPSAQTITSYSTGDSPSAATNLVVTANEGGSARTLSALSATANSDITITSATYTTGVIVVNTSAMSSDSGTITISASTTNSEGTTVTKSLTATISKAKAATPVVLVSATPQTQNTTANPSGVQTGTFNNVVVSVSNGTFVDMTKTQSGFSTNPTISSNTLTMSSAVITTANTSASVTLTVNYTDSEGTDGSQNIVITVTKSNDGDKGDTGDPGDPGTNGLKSAANMVHYQVSSTSAPATPSATSYNFGTNSFTGLTANWATGAPTYASGNTNKYWYSTYTVTETTSGGGTGVPSFSTPVQAIGFSGLVSFTANETVGDGTNNLSFGVSGTTLINGDNISTGRIISTNYVTGSGDGFTNTGTEFSLDEGLLASKNFMITPDGSAFFKGDLTGANITGATGTFTGTVQIGGTTLTTGNTLNANTTADDVDLGNVENLDAQNQAQSGLISGTTITGGGITLSGGGNIKGGQTNYNTGTGFFLGYHGSAYKFSIGNASSKGITWDGNSLSIGGDVNIGATLASTVVSGASAGATAIQNSSEVDLSEADNSTSGYQNNTATRTGGSVGGWGLEQYKIKGGAPTSGGDGVFTNTGIILGIESVSGNGYISAQNFYVSSSGDALFGGTLSGADIYGGTININDNFYVGSSGTMTANNAVISGQITSEDATLGAWSVGPDSIEAENGQISLNATDGTILLKDSSLVTKVNLNIDSSLTTPAAGGSISGTTNATVQTDEETVAADGIKYYSTTQGNDAQDIANFTPSTTGTWSIGYSYTQGNGSYVYATGIGNYSSVSVYLEVRTGANGGGTLVKSAYIQSQYAAGTDSGNFSVDENTKITLSDGTTKLAKDIKTNDTLLVWDESVNSFKASGVGDIRKKIVERVYEVCVGDIKLVTSENHGFWIDGGAQIKVQDLIENQTEIYVKDGENIKLKTVTSVRVLEKQSQVITFKIPKYENYISENIISHNPAGDDYPIIQYGYFTNRTGSTSMNLSSGTTYYLRLRYDWTRTLVGSTWTSSRNAGYYMNFDGNYSGNSLNAGTEINNAGLQVLSGTSRVFRADTAAATGPWLTAIGGMNVDYFVPKYSAHTAQSKVWGQYNTELGYDKRAYPVTRAMCRFTVSTSYVPSINNPQVNVATVSRSAQGIYTVTLEDDLGIQKGLPIISSYGRANDSPSYYPSDAEFTSNMAAKHNTTADSYTLGFKDNDRNDNDDPYMVHFVVFG